MSPLLQEMMNNLAPRELLKAITTCMAIFLVIAYCLFDRKRLRAKPWVMELLLGIVSLASAASYLEYGWLRYNSYSNPHDFYHQYIA